MEASTGPGVCSMADFFSRSTNKSEDLNCSCEAVANAGIELNWPITADFYFGLCSLIAHVLLTGVTVVISRKCLALKLAKTAEHAFYCTLAFVFCMGEALLVRHSHVVRHGLGIERLDVLHSALGLLAFCVGFLGVGIKTYQKRERKRDEPTAVVRHFRSKHGFFGLLGCLCLVLSVASGLAMYVLPPRIELLLGHRLAGVLGFGLLMTSQVLSYDTGFARRQWKQRTNQLFKLCTFIALITTVNYEFRCLVRDLAAQLPQQLFKFLKTK